MNTASTKSKRGRSNEDSKRSPAKRKFRNENEKRRRDLFSQLTTSLENILNIDPKPSSSSTTDQTNKLDKASILRETAIYLRKHQDDLTIRSNIPSSNPRTTVEQSNELLDFSWRPPLNLVANEEWLQTVIESMNCFFLVAKSDPHNGQIVYVSRNISSLLDYSQNELLNRSLFELILPRDHDQLRDYFLKDHKVIEKCHLSWRRAIADEYEHCTIIGAFRQIKKTKEEISGKYLMAIVQVNTIDRTLTQTNENSLHDFTIRLNLQGRFIQIDPNIRQLLGYTSYELIGHTFFDFVHPDDLPIIVRAQQLWKDTGHGQSDPYRFLTKGQQWLFVQTSCQVQTNSWSAKPESYLCLTNLLLNSTDFLHKQPSTISTAFQTTISSIQTPLTTTTATSSMLISTPSGGDASSDNQITSFLSQLENETYRINIREKLNERRLCKQAEIHVREEEINVIEDMIQFIDEYQSKRLPKHSLRMTKPSLRHLPMITTINSSYQATNLIIPDDSFNSVNRLDMTSDPIIIQSPLTVTLEDLPHLLSKDETILDPLPSVLFSPHHETFTLSSPRTPFSIPPRPSPALLSVSPTSSSSLPRSISPSTNTSIPHDINQIIPSTSSPSSSSSTTTSSTIHSTDQSSKKSSFNRSLPHSLVS